MSNLKKYLKVYKEDAKHKKAFQQYMMVISENQDFFTRHEVNEFFTDMIKDGTLVYDEGWKQWAAGAAIFVASLFPSKIESKSMELNTAQLQIASGSELVQMTSPEQIGNFKYNIEDIKKLNTDELIPALAFIKISCAVNNQNKFGTGETKRNQIKLDIEGVLKKRLESSKDEKEKEQIKEALDLEITVPKMQTAQEKKIENNVKTGAKELAEQFKKHNQN